MTGDRGLAPEWLAMWLEGAGQLELAGEVRAARSSAAAASMVREAVHTDVHDTILERGWQVEDPQYAELESFAFQAVVSTVPEAAQTLLRRGSAADVDAFESAVLASVALALRGQADWMSRLEDCARLISGTAAAEVALDPLAPSPAPAAV